MHVFTRDRLIIKTNTKNRQFLVISKPPSQIFQVAQSKIGRFCVSVSWMKIKKCRIIFINFRYKLVQLNVQPWGLFNHNTVYRAHQTCCSVSSAMTDTISEIHKLNSNLPSNDDGNFSLLLHISLPGNFVSRKF